MVLLVLGGSGSGKSAWAEALAVSLWARSGGAGRGPLLYLATMDAPDEESRRRVARHRAQRAGKGFATLERPLDLLGLPLPPGAAVLLEDLGNLAANELYAPVGGGSPALIPGVERLAKTAEHLVLVGNAVFSDGANWEEGAGAYLRALGELQNRCAALADGVVEVVCGLPLWHKRPNAAWFEEVEKEAGSL